MKHLFRRFFRPHPPEPLNRQFHHDLAVLVSRYERIGLTANEVIDELGYMRHLCEETSKSAPEISKE
jgi:hypothetical protein